MFTCLQVYQWLLWFLGFVPGGQERGGSDLLVNLCRWIL